MPVNVNPIQILPSLLAADMGQLEDACRRAEQAGADGLHIDIMDGHFVPNLSMGPDVVRMAKRTVRIPLSVHLMVTRPDQLADAFLDAGADLLHIHIEAACDVAAVLRHVRTRGRRPGIVFNPETPVEALDGVLDLVDEVLVMTVHPGFGGQAFIPEALPKIRALRARRPRLDLAVDGGVTRETSRESAGAGANVLLAGTSLYRAADMAGEIQLMRAEARAAQGAAP